MEYTQWAETQQNPNPNSTIPAANYSQNPVSVPYQPPAFNPHNALFQPQPPGVDQPYAPPQYVPQQYAPPATVNYAQQQQSVDAAATTTAAAYYYPDPNVNWAAAAAYSQMGAVNYAAPQGISTPNHTNQLPKRHTGKKGPKKPKIVQPAWCEVCKIDCNSTGVLDQHRLGKKHLKNLEKLKAKLAPPPPVVKVDAPVIAATPPTVVAASTSLPESATPVAPADTPIIGPQENPEKPVITKSRRRSAARKEDLETKKRRVLSGGADAESVHACDICNVVCNSATVYKYHLAGQKHASMVKKHGLNPGAAAAATATNVVVAATATATATNVAVAANATAAAM